jgi:hypothetical protein
MLDFKELFRQRMKLLKGIDRSVLQVIFFDRKNVFYRNGTGSGLERN